MAANAALEIKVPKLDAAKRDTVSDDEARDLLIGASRLPNKRRAAMAKAVLSMLLYAALRRQELLDLRLPDINFADGSVVVRSGKGQKARTVWPNHDALVAVREWLRLRLDAKEDWLWPVDRSRPMGFNGIRVLVEEVKTVSGLSDHHNIHPHAMRRGCATRLMVQGTDIRSIQGFLGHSCLETTAICLASNQQRLKQISHLGGLHQGPVNPAAQRPKEEAPRPHTRSSDHSAARRTSYRQDKRGSPP